MRSEGRRGARDFTTEIEAALAGNRHELFRHLELGSGLPGPRMNVSLAHDFAASAARIGPPIDALVFEMASAPANEARGASPKEFLSVCGVFAIAARAVASGDLTDRGRALSLFEDLADDLRFRVREAVPTALTMLGSKWREELLPLVAHWSDRYFHAAAVLLALRDPTWLETFPVHAFEGPIAFVDASFGLAVNAPRSASRYPGHKALVETLGKVPNALIKRFGLPMFEHLGLWTKGLEMPELRAAILANLDDPAFKKPYADEIRKVRELVEGSKKPPRDPTKLVAGMRGRAKKRSRR